MSRASRWPVSLRPLGACASAALAVVAGAVVSGSPAQATPPVGVLAASVPAAQGDTGTIKGRLVWGGAEAPKAKVLEAKGQASKDPNVCAKDAPIVDEKLVVDPSSKGVRYAIVYLVKPSGAAPDAAKELVEKNPKVEIDQKDCRFVPRTVGLNKDQELVLKSSDPVNHNVHLSAFTNESFNVLLPANGSLNKRLIPEKRALPLTCDIHPWMKANIMVFDHPYFAVTGEDGSFEIKDVPAGTQNLVIWQEAVGYVTAGGARGIPVKVEAGKDAEVGEVKLDPSKVKS